MKVFESFDTRDVPLRWLGIGIACGMAALFAACAWHQLVKARDYRELGQRQSFRTVRVPAPRGRILDREGRPLAENRPDYLANLYLDELRPEFQHRYKQLAAGRKVSTQESRALEDRARIEVVQAAARRAGALIGVPIEVEPDRIRLHYETARAMPMALAAGLRFDQIARIEEQPEAVPGLAIDVHRRRHYPNGPLAAHVAGHIQHNNDSRENEPAEYNYRLPDYLGKAGVEGAFDRVLSGIAAERALVVNNLGYRHAVFDAGEPRPGADVQLTLDLGLQARAEVALRGRRGAMVVMDARTGDLLVLASAPTFDPSLFTTTMSTQTWASLNDKHLTPMVNRATAGIYAPGSIFKIMVGLACLENGLDPGASLRTAENYSAPGMRPVRDLAPPGEYNFRRAFLKSSNGYFIHHGMQLGSDTWESLAKLSVVVSRLHLGERTGVPVMQESSGDYPTRDTLRRRNVGWPPGEMAYLCIGQGPISVTPLQMAVMTAAVVNGGDVLWPRIVDRILPAVGAPEIAPPVPSGAVRDRLGVSARSLGILREAMLADVSDAEGTGRGAAVTGMVIGGKTGTAQVTQGRRVVDQTTWFASFAETAQRLYAVVVMVESGEGGGTTCAPIARQMYQAIDEWERRPRQLARNEQGRGGAR